MFRKHEGVWKYILGPKERIDMAKKLHEVFGNCGVDTNNEIVRLHTRFLVDLCECSIKLFGMLKSEVKTLSLTLTTHF